MNVFAITGLIVDDLNNTRQDFDCFTDTENNSVFVFCNSPEKIASGVNALLDSKTDGKYYDIEFILNDNNYWEIGYIHHNNGKEDVRQKIRQQVESLGLANAYNQICDNIVNQANI